MTRVMSHFELKQLSNFWAAESSSSNDPRPDHSTAQLFYDSTLVLLARKSFGPKRLPTCRRSFCSVDQFSGGGDNGVDG